MAETTPVVESPPVAAAESRSDDLDVLLWRHEQFLDLGYGEYAWTLARAPVDLGRARSLHKAGCPASLALRILL